MSRQKQFFEYKKGQIIKKILMNDIIYFESNGKKIKIFSNNKVIEYYGKLSDVNHQLCNQDFLFIHKSYLINFLHVIEYQYNYVKMSNKNVLSISRQNKKIVRDRLSQRRNWGL